MFCSFIHDEHWKSNLIAHKNAVAASKEEEKRQENAKKKAEEDAKKKAEACQRPTSAAGQGHVVSPPMQQPRSSTPNLGAIPRIQCNK